MRIMSLNQSVCKTNLCTLNGRCKNVIREIQTAQISQGQQVGKN